MPKTRVTKERVLITIDKELVKRLKNSKIKASQLINNLLWKHYSQDPKHHSLKIGNAEVPGSIPFREPVESSFENGDISFSIKSIYLKQLKVYTNHVMGKYSKDYARAMLSALEKLMPLIKDESPTKILQTIDKSKLDLQYCIKGLRNFLLYLESKDLIDDTILNLYLRKFKTPNNFAIDTFVPTSYNVKNALIHLRDNYPPPFQTLYLLLLESGARYTEIKHLILNFNKTKVEKVGSFILYNNMYLRHNKTSFYLFFTKETFREFLKHKDAIASESYLDSVKDRICRNKKLIPVKYLRKYNFTLLIKSSIPIETANWIQGRSSKDVGFNHYLAKKEVAVKEYEKFIKKLKQELL